MNTAVPTKFNMGQSWIDLGFDFPKVPFFLYKRRFYFTQGDSRGRPVPGMWTVWDKRDLPFPKSFTEEELMSISLQEFDRVIGARVNYFKEVYRFLGRVLFWIFYIIVWAIGTFALWIYIKLFKFKPHT